MSTLGSIVAAAAAAGWCAAGINFVGIMLPINPWLAFGCSLAFATSLAQLVRITGK